jgi:hypothetical protein
LRRQLCEEGREGKGREGSGCFGKIEGLELAEGRGIGIRRNGGAIAVSGERDSGGQP